MRERVRVSEIGRVQALADPKGTVWSRYGLLDVLDAPLPLTASLLRRMMGRRGALGRLHHALGFEPDRALDELGVVDLICGRPYVNLSRLSRMQGTDFPFRYAVDEFRNDPSKAQWPMAQLDLRGAALWQWRHLPHAMARVVRARRRLEHWRVGHAEPLVNGVAPLFAAEVRRAQADDLGALDAASLAARARAWVRRVVDEFAVEVLKTETVASYATHVVMRRRGSEETARLLAGVRPRAEADVQGLLERAAWTPWPFESLLEAVGHRGGAELELASPRWRETPERLRDEVLRLRAVPPVLSAPMLKAALDGDVVLARAWIALRETAVHWLMFGWGEIRRTLLALDRRLRLDGGVFWLTYEELAPAAEGGVRRDLLDERIERHRLMEGVSCPRVLFSDDLDALGRA